MKTYTYAIGDLHGRLDVLIKSIELIEDHRKNNNAKAIVVFLGDYVDRGQNSKEVCDILMSGPQTDNTEWICLQGNHEIMALEAHHGGSSEHRFWTNNGGDETAKSFGGKIPLKYLQWMAQLKPFYYDGKRVFVHAGIKEGVPLEQTPEAVLQWIRYPDEYEPNSPLGYLVHGHTPKMGQPLILKTRCDLDVWSVATGKVCVAIFENGTPGGPIDLLEANMGYRALD